MSASSEEPTAKRQRTDAVIGLDVAGKLYYCRTSTLTVGGSSSYFAARFGPDRMFDPEVDRVDEHGRNVYFIDRDPDMFKHILDYLRMGKLPARLGSFQENADLWRALRDEADFYALDGLVSLLKVTYKCSPDRKDGKGVLYWLGTNKGKEEYTNPYKKQMIDVTGWFDTDPGNWNDNCLSVYDCNARENFVQFRPRAKVGKELDLSIVGGDYFETLMRCGSSDQDNAIIVDIREYAVSPTHYSLRWGECYGLRGKWNFEGSANGTDWVVLHTGRDEDGHKVSCSRHLKRGIEGETPHVELLINVEDETTRNDSYCDYMERHYRHVWELENSPDLFFRYFRMIGGTKRVMGVAFMQLD